MEEYPELDSYCSEIMLILFAKGKMRTNELYRTLRKLNVRLSKPSLVDHLRHLTKKNLVIRRKEGKQFITYERNDERFLSTKEQDEKVRTIFDDLFRQGETKKFDLPVHDDANADLYSFVQMLLVDLQRRLLFRSILKLKLEDPRQYIEFLVFGNPFFQARENELVANSLKDEKYQDELFSKIEELIEEMKKRKRDSYKFTN